MKGWRRQKKPPESESDAQLLARLVPKITIAHSVVPPLESDQRKLDAELRNLGFDPDDAMEVSNIFNQYA